MRGVLLNYPVLRLVVAVELLNVVRVDFGNDHRIPGASIPAAAHNRHRFDNDAIDHIERLVWGGSRIEELLGNTRPVVTAEQ